MTKRVAIAGASGLIGGALRRHLVERGDDVVVLVRRPSGASDEVAWDPQSGTLDPNLLAGVDAIVNLAGAGIGDKRWNDEHKRLVLTSRLDATRTIVGSIATERQRSGRIVRLVNASAVGYYGDRGDEVLAESSPPGTDFLASVVVAWEQAALAAEPDASVAVIRTGLVMSPDGGAFKPLLLLSRLGLGGPLGSGRQWWPWITLTDEVRAIAHLVDDPDLTGAFNLAAPDEARQADIARALARALHRPAVLPVPQFALRAVIGEFADGIVASQRVHPERLAAAGFVFEQPDLASAVRWTVQR
ncbi:TIGR01777 family oxidoreductase [Intrasporangium sp.]|uniref:TIGR01777 family oxidoreductase n=1 Tax=Intrasporangium sp. TaxID=1925024 RepID=UPI002939CD31|nr:TIGR01777 family oxidoreductase [Intrasporangium sp.]MDV3220787.1 TIGR01777 family oxidoreductase [Intrasporangium sp.]